MKSYVTLIILSVAALLFPTALLAQTNCDDQPKPALDCPTGYTMMCIPVGGDHWGCGKQNADGTFEEASPDTAVAGGSLATTSISPTTEQTAPAGTAISDPGTSSTSSGADMPVQEDPAPREALLAQTSLPPPTPSDQVSTSSLPAEEPVGQVSGADQSTPSPAADAPYAGLGTADREMLDLETLEEATNILAEDGPTALRPVMAAVASTLAAVVALLGFWEWFKRLKEKRTKKCGRCGGDKEEAKKEPCATCGGKRTIEKEFEVTIKCLHCGGSGTDPCHHCSGTGKMSMPNPPQSQEELEGWPPCDFCGGSGKKKIGAGRDWGEANDAMKGDFACCFCHGKKEMTYKEKRQVPCPTCAK